jgi:hypothetical protein
MDRAHFTRMYRMLRIRERRGLSGGLCIWGRYLGIYVSSMSPDSLDSSWGRNRYVAGPSEVLP